MNTKKTSSKKVSGIIMMACAVGIIILNIAKGMDLDSYIMPTIFLSIGTSFLTMKEKAEDVKQHVEASIKRNKILLPITIIALLTGIGSFIFTLVIE